MNLIITNHTKYDVFKLAKLISGLPKTQNMAVYEDEDLNLIIVQRKTKTGYSMRAAYLKKEEE